MDTFLKYFYSLLSYSFAILQEFNTQESPIAFRVIYKMIVEMRRKRTGARRDRLVK